MDPIQVYCSACKKWINEDDQSIELIDSSTDENKKDTLIFKHADCKTEQTSIRA
jgi:hypothetical protein